MPLSNQKTGYESGPMSIYESRGGEPGQHEQDWFRAEQEIPERGK